jgi:PAS domain S-box-containing protein
MASLPTERVFSPQFDFLADTAPVMISFANGRGEIEYANAAWLAFNGWKQTPEDASSWLDKIHPDDLPLVPRPGPEALERSESFRFTARTRNAAGEYRWIRTHGQPWRDAEGKVIGFLACSFDVTDEKHIREELMVAEERMRLVIAGSQDAVWDWNLETGDFYYSPRWWQILGFAPDEFSVDSTLWKQLVHPDDLERAERLLAQVHRDGRNHLELEMRFRHRDGHYVPVLSRGMVIGDATGRPKRILGTNTDLTERRRAEHERLAALDILQKVAARVPGVVYQYRLRADGTGSFPYASDKIREIYRVTPEQVAQSSDPVLAILHPDDAPAVMASIEASRVNLTPWILEYRVRFSDGTVRWLLGNALPEREADGAVLWHGFIMDCTDRKAAEQEREQLAEQLRESQKMQAIGTLAGGIAHDFNNIAGAILGNVELALQDAQDSPDLLRCLTEIRDAAERASGLTRQILAFSRRQPTNRTVFAVQPRIEAIKQLLRKALLAPVTLECNFAADASVVLADAVQFDQVMLNLLNNAAQALEGRPGKISIHVDEITESPPTTEYGHGQAPRRYTRIRVADTGRGMDPAITRRIFEPFYTTKPVDQGTGLGLSVVYGIMEAHGGRVSAESEVGVGSTFTLLFPAYAGTAAAGAVAPLPATASGGGRILYIDDDPALLSMVGRLLGRRGFTVTTAESGELGLDLLRADPGAFDIVLIDYNMPGMKGTEVAIAVQRIRPGLSMALASGYITDAVREEARRAGITELIFKANAVAEFCAVVERLALQSAAGVAASSAAPGLD